MSHFCITRTDPAVPGRTWMRLCGGRSLARFRLTSCDSSSLKATSVISRAATHRASGSPRQKAAPSQPASRSRWPNWVPTKQDDDGGMWGEAIGQRGELTCSFESRSKGTATVISSPICSEAGLPFVACFHSRYSCILQQRYGLFILRLASALYG